MRGLLIGMWISVDGPDHFRSANAIRFRQRRSQPTNWNCSQKWRDMPLKLGFAPSRPSTFSLPSRTSTRPAMGCVGSPRPEASDMALTTARLRKLRAIRKPGVDRSAHHFPAAVRDGARQHWRVGGSRRQHDDVIITRAGCHLPIVHGRYADPEKLADGPDRCGTPRATTGQCRTAARLSRSLAADGFRPGGVLLPGSCVRQETP